ncbi:MAG: hypothetical protein KDI68_10790 [Gammaproteobacteria bacterium]|nr:hypothetical protein [Gammaproteobacteria bacterium]
MSLISRLAILVGAFAFFSPANAVLINTSIGAFEVTAAAGLSIDQLDEQPWWDDNILAREFAELVDLSLGTFVQPLSTGVEVAPFFAITPTVAIYCGTGCDPFGAGAIVYPDNWDASQAQFGPVTFAVAERAQISEPSVISLLTFGLVGAGLARRRVAR